MNPKITNLPDRAEALKKRASVTKAQVFSLQPHLERTELALPNQLVRSALFTANARQVKRKLLHNDTVYAQGGISISFSGEELRVDDETLWMYLVSLFDGLDRGAHVDLQSSQILKNLDKSNAKANYEWLRNSLFRLKQGAIKVTDSDGRLVMLSLIDYLQLENARDKRSKSGVWRIRLSPEAMALFAEKRITKIDMDIRRRLPAGIATKLHAYILSHKRPYPAKLESLFKLCFNRDAADEMDLRRFRWRLVKALDQLVEVGQLHSYVITPDYFVHLRREPDTKSYPS